MNNEQIKIKINGGYLIAGKNGDVDYDGIHIYYQADDGGEIDIVRVECKAENNQEKIDVYCYEDVYDEDFTNKYTLDNKEIYKAINE